MKLKLLVATGNAHKLKEISQILSPYDIEVVGLKDENILIGDIEENGTTYSENAFIKASEVAKYTSLPVISDDSGLEVVSFDDRPGLFSARFAESSGGHDKAMATILEAIEGKDRSAKFICSICLIDEYKNKHIFNGITTGVIADKPEGNGGFGYDPIFICDDLNKNYALLTEEEKNTVSHRAKALNELVKYLKTR